jgi:hypothetical protein
MLDSLITSKTRIRLLVKFFINVANTGYLRGLAIEMNENTNAIRKELNNLCKAGYIVRDSYESKVMYRANTAHPLFASLQQLIRKHIGIDNIIAQILERMGEVTRIFVLGDYAQGIDSNNIEIVIEGPNLNESYIQQLVPKIENEIHREVNIQITPLFLGEGLLIFENN